MPIMSADYKLRSSNQHPFDTDYSGIRDGSIPLLDFTDEAINYINSIGSPSGNSSIASLSSTTIDLNSRLNTVSADVVTLQPSLTTVSADVLILESSLTTVSADVVLTESSLTTVSADVLILESSLSSVSADVVDLTSRLNTVSADVVTLQPSLTTVSGNYVAITADDTILVNSVSGNIQISLPTVTAFPIYKIYNIKKLSSSNVVYVVANGSETIDGSVSAVMTSQYDSVTIQTDKNNWYIL